MSENVHKAFVEKFIDYWAAPAAERMPEILTNDVVLIQPLSYPMEGLAAAQDEFRRLFQWIPDLRGEINHWGGARGYTFHRVHPVWYAGAQHKTTLAPGGSI